jgi:hypothetical protein
MKIIDYIYPSRVLNRYREYSKILKYKKTYIQIIDNLEKTGKLKEMELTRQNEFLLLGINLNEQILTYDEITIEPAELRYVADKLKKYTDFLQKEGILDSVFVDYERVKTDDYYGYIIQIKFEDRKYNQKDHLYCGCYLFGIPSLILGTLALIFI